MCGPAHVVNSLSLFSFPVGDAPFCTPEQHKECAEPALGQYWENRGSGGEIVGSSGGDTKSAMEKVAGKGESQRSSAGQRSCRKLERKRAEEGSPEAPEMRTARGTEMAMEEKEISQGMEDTGRKQR